MRKLLPFLLLSLTLAGLSPAASALQTDSSQGLTWTQETQTVFTGQSNSTVNATAGNTTASSDGAWVDEQGGDWNVNAGVLINPGVHTGGGYGSYGWLDRPASVTTTNQRIILKGFAFAAGWNNAVNLRINATNRQSYTVTITPSTIQGYYFNNFGGTGGAFTLVSGLPANVTPNIPVGDYYLIDLSAVSNAGHTTTTIAVTVTDLGTNAAATTGTIVAAGTSSPDTGAGVQGGGQIGLGSLSTSSQTVSLTTYNNGVLTTPTLQAGTGGVVATAPGSATIVSTVATGGTAPYTYALYRSVTPLFTAGQAGTLVGTQANLSAGTAPLLTDSSVTSGLYFYKWLVTDSAGTPASAQVQPVPASVPDRAYRALFLGDSRTRGGIGAVYLRQYAVIPVLLIGGSGYTSAPTVTATDPSGFTGVSATYACSISGGAVNAVWPTSRGSRYTALGPTLTFTGGGGSGATTATPASGAPQAGGGVCLAAERQLSFWGGGIHAVTVINGGEDGSGVATFPPGSWQLESAIAQAGSPSVCPIIRCDWGVNDAAGGTTATQFRTSYLALAQNLVGRGYIVVLDYPYYRVPDYNGAGDSTNDLVIQYRAMIDQVIASDPTHIKHGTTVSNALFAANPALLLPNDGLHPGDVGAEEQARLDAEALAPLFGLTAAPSTAPLTLTAMAGSNSEVLTWTADSGATNGYEVDWKPSSVLPVAGQVKSIVAIVGPGVLTWTDTSAYRLAQSGRYNVVGLH